MKRQKRKKKITHARTRIHTCFLCPGLPTLGVKLFLLLIATCTHIGKILKIAYPLFGRISIEISSLFFSSFSAPNTLRGSVNQTFLPAERFIWFLRFFSIRRVKKNKIRFLHIEIHKTKRKTDKTVFLFRQQNYAAFFFSIESSLFPSCVEIENKI